MQDTPVITTDALRKKLSSGEAVNIIDVRPLQERSEWFIPGSIHIDVYDRLKQRDFTVFDDIQLDASTPVVTVCAGGKVSLTAANILKQKGYNAFSLQNGMKGWSLAWNIAHQEFNGFELWQIRRTGKGCLSYIIASGKEATIIDASLPVEVYTELVSLHGLSIKYVIETHIHADHLSRSKEIAQYYNIPLYLPVPNNVQFEYNPIEGGTKFAVGAVVLQSIPTPGHTFNSFSFYIDDSILLTGDTLFTNGVGRPDLKSSGEESREKAEMLYQSLQKLLLLHDSVMVLPAHTNRPVEFDNKLIAITIGEAKRNITLLQSGKDEFIHLLLLKIPPTPPNFLAITEKNITGNYEGVNPIDLEAGANRCAIS
ncbi:MBL fold metallo-hydrolase [Pseudoflavitalea sp. X16]|uniref:MBL fold metallo-hydrolase n=1 Tax=Paraflavitalea devenefica TaxID=2716334 RepID=UPI00142239D0|nr:MBL fold metallo-hydrolase [Paraflavitalea devenefica]NII26357.1 MBL fold metallo-hydrolase [Paraflavitalea devenefica]